MISAAPVLKDLVLVGGGHSHVQVVKSFAMEPMPGVRLTVVARDAHAPYSGMLPGLIAGHYAFDEAHIDLRPLARMAGARFVHDEVTAVDPTRKAVSCGNRPPLPYDVLSIDIGSSPSLDVPGAAACVVPVKPIAGFWPRWQALRDRCLERRDETRIGVVGGGAGGVELLLAVQYRLQTLLAEQGRNDAHLHYHLVTASDEILPTHNFRVRDKFRRILAERGVEVRTGQAVRAVVAGEDVGPPAAGRGRRLELDGGDHLDVDEVLWVTDARAARWPGEGGLDVDERGFIRVRDTMQSVSRNDVFAAGDVAAMIDHPHPAAGVFAVRQGPPLAANLRAALLGEPAEPFRPQQKFLGLISTGDRYAVASRGEWAAEGAWVWRWKDRIDRRFVERFNDLPDMEAVSAPARVDARLIDDAAASRLVRAAAIELRRMPPGSSDREKAAAVIATPPPRCGGCGAKVGAALLARVLAQVEPVRRDDVVLGLDGGDDAAVIEVPVGKQLVQSSDFFRDFIGDPYVFGAVAANHALGDIFAMGATPQSALANVTVPFGLESKVEADLRMLLAGALGVLTREQTALIGGHTAEGAELALGFTVNGLVDRGAAVGKGGLRPGDALVLTKPLGTGALFAADMRWRARGRWIAAATASMVQSSRAAARCLLEFGAAAMTDVTGFGLLGHLIEMTRASGVAAAVDLDKLPLLDGAREVVGEGFTSSLHADNARLRRALADVEGAAAHPAYPLLFDPQTAGGLLAGVAGDKVEECVNTLRRQGYVAAAAVGVVQEQGPDKAAVRLTHGIDRNRS